MERLTSLLDPTFTAALGTRTLDDLRDRKTECTEVEHALSYLRRLSQARMEILHAEQARRERGASVEDLVADLPRILSAESGRSSVTTTRVSSADTPSIQLHWPDSREELVADATLANLPVLAPDELAATLQRLEEFEREVSDLRHRLHVVIDTLEQEITTRQVAGTAG